MTVQQLDSFHTQGNTAVLSWYASNSNSLHNLIRTSSDYGQTLFPFQNGVPAQAQFTTTGAFGFNIDNIWSTDSKNNYAPGNGNDHDVRFFPMRDASGNLIPNTYIMAMDYPSTTQNFDTNDNIYIVSNIRPSTIPAAPASVYTQASATGVSVTWEPVTDSTLKGYNVYSSLSISGGFALLNAAPITGTSFFDTGALPGTILYYKVTAVDGTGESLGRTSSVVTQGTPIAGLESVDVGAVPSGSTTIINPGTDYNVTAGGPGATGTSDGFRFLFTQQTGNFDMMVQVDSLTVAGSFSTAGIMARSTLGANSPDVYMSASPVNYRFKSRSTVGGNTNVIASNNTNSYPNVWVRLSRVGNLFTGYYSADGVNWTTFSSITLALPTTLDLGLAVASNDTTQTTTAQLRGYGVTSVPVPVPPPTPTSFTATGVAGGDELQWSPVSDPLLAGYEIFSSSSASGPFTQLTPTPITATNFLDGKASVSAATFYQLIAVDTNTLQSTTPATASATALPGVADPLTSADIGASPAGSTTMITPGSAYTVVAGGPGFTGTAGGFRYLYTQQTGNFDMMVQVDSLTVAGTYSTAGILASATADPTSPGVYMSASPVNYRFKDRTTVGGTTNIVSPSVTNSYPNVWVRLSRVGNVFTGYYSSDGIHWTQVSTITLALPTTIELGLAVASNDTTQTTTAQLSNYGVTSVPAPVPPTAPTNLTATGVAGGVSLNWSPVAAASKGYNVYSSTSASGPFTLLTTTPITGTSYLDTKATIGSLTYYEVTAVGSSESTPATANGTAQAGVVDPLTSLDIGASPAGSTTVLIPGSSYSVTAGGPGVTGNTDGFRYLYTQQTGNFDVMVQVNSLTVAGNFSTAGILARATLDPTSPDVYMSASPVNYRFKDRTTAGGTTNIISSTGANSYPNVWVRLSRVSNLFTGYFSSDGVHWTTLSSLTLALPTTIDLGLAVAANETTGTTTAVLSNYGNTVATPAAPTNLTATGVAGGVSLQWSGTGPSYNVYSSTSASGPFTLLTTTPITATSYLDTKATVGSITYYRVTAIGSSESTPATANATALAVVPVALTSVDIGASLAGTTTPLSSNSYQVTAGGPGVTANSDGFRYLYTQVTGNFDVSVQVNSLSVAGTFSTAGIMARSTLDANSPDVYMSASPVNYRFKDRTTAGGTTNIISPNVTNSYPNVWVRLTRVGNIFTGYYSSDGVTWTMVSSVTMALPTTIDLGLAVASNDTADATTAVLSNYGTTA